MRRRGRSGRACDDSREPSDSRERGDSRKKFGQRHETGRRRGAVDAEEVADDIAVREKRRRRTEKRQDECDGDEDFEEMGGDDRRRKRLGNRIAEKYCESQSEQDYDRDDEVGDRDDEDADPDRSRRQRRERRKQGRSRQGAGRQEDPVEEDVYERDDADDLDRTEDRQKASRQRRDRERGRRKRLSPDMDWEDCDLDKEVDDGADPSADQDRRQKQRRERRKHRRSRREIDGQEEPSEEDDDGRSDDEDVVERNQDRQIASRPRRDRERRRRKMQSPDVDQEDSPDELQKEHVNGGGSAKQRDRGAGRQGRRVADGESPEPEDTEPPLKRRKRERAALGEDDITAEKPSQVQSGREAPEKQSEAKKRDGQGLLDFMNESRHQEADHDAAGDRGGDAGAPQRRGDNVMQIVREPKRHRRGRFQLIGDVVQKWNWCYHLRDKERNCFVGHLRQPFSPQKTEDLYNRVWRGTSWIRPNGPQGPLPRKVAWMTERPCICAMKYAGYVYEPKPFPEWMIDILADYMPLCGIRDEADWPNCCSLNLYENGTQCLNWHSDDEDYFQGLVSDCRIISLSLGETRKFQVRLAGTKGSAGNDPTVRTIDLADGDLCTMEGLTQKYYEHCAPMSGAFEKINMKPRINLTWRWIVAHCQRCAEPDAPDDNAASQPEVLYNDFSKTFQIPPTMVPHVMTEENRNLLGEVSGAIVDWNLSAAKVLLSGPPEVTAQAERVLTRVVTHCQWGCNREKVGRLIKPRVLRSVGVKLSPMSRLKPAEKTLSVGNKLMSIGKGNTCDVVIADQMVSRQHCVLEFDESRGAVYAIDYSTNGTFLNGKRLPLKQSGKVMVSHGDELVFRDPSGGPENAEYGYMVNLMILEEGQEIAWKPRQMPKAFMLNYQ